MRFEPTEIDELSIIVPERHSDERGSFARVFCRDEFKLHGLVTEYVQASVSVTLCAGTLRGMHFQRPPHAETKLVRCVRGEVYDVVADLRPHSPSFGRWQAFHLNERDGLTLYIPDGCAHGFQTLRDECEILYQMSVAYAPQCADGFRFDDPTFQIEWPLPVGVIAPKDLEWSPISERIPR